MRHEVPHGVRVVSEGGIVTIGGSAYHYDAQTPDLLICHIWLPLTLDVQSLHPPDEVHAVDGVAIAEQIPGSRIVGKGVDDLPERPRSRVATCSEARLCKKEARASSANKIVLQIVLREWVTCG